MQVSVAIKNVSVSLSGVSVLEKISIDIPKGKIIGLLGPSGAGKTTLIKTILGLRKLSAGEVSVLDIPAGNAKLRSKIGYVSQDPSVYADLSVRENIDYFAVLVGAGKSQTEMILKDLERSEHKDRLVSTLSGGQKARVSLGVALLGKPELLLLDEPTVGLDPVLRRKLWNRFRKLAAGGITLIISSHVMDEADKCDEIIFIRGGRLLASGSKQDILSRTASETMEQAFLKLSKDGGE